MRVGIGWIIEQISVAMACCETGKCVYLEEDFLDGGLIRGELFYDVKLAGEY